MAKGKAFLEGKLHYNLKGMCEECVRSLCLCQIVVLTPKTRMSFRNRRERLAYGAYETGSICCV